MIENYFSITSSDGKLNEHPSGEFTATSAYPTDSKTLMKGTSDLVCVNDGLAGCLSSNSISRPSFYIEENGEPATVRMDNGSYTAFLGWGAIKLKGTTIYGYIITQETKPNHPGTGRDELSYVINFITNPEYKLAEPTYEGWGLTGVSITAANKLWHGYSIEGVIGVDAPNRLQFGPILWNYYKSDQYPQLDVAYMTVIDGSLAINRFIASVGAAASFQSTDNTDYVKLFGSRKITILNTDIIIPSLEDRVSALEKEMAKLPADINQALVTAVEEVSKLYVAR